MFAHTDYGRLSMILKDFIYLIEIFTKDDKSDL